MLRTAWQWLTRVNAIGDRLADAYYALYVGLGLAFFLIVIILKVI